MAARGGRVQSSGYHGAAGNYIVIDGAGTMDYAYMHLAEPSAFDRATASTPASGSARWATPATPAAATCTSSCGAGPGWYDGGRRSTPSLAEGVGLLVVAAGCSRPRLG